MLQRNNTDHALVVIGPDLVRHLEPGDDMEYETPVAGLTVVELAAESDPQAPADGKSRRKTAAPAQPEEGN